MQLESVHFLCPGDRVAHVDGREGEVTEAFALWALVRWDGAAEEEVEQLDPDIAVTVRAAA
jgi:hypothetical protein